MSALPTRMCLEPATASRHRSTTARSVEIFPSPGSIPTGPLTVSVAASMSTIDALMPATRTSPTMTWTRSVPRPRSEFRFRNSLASTSASVRSGPNSSRANRRPRRLWNSGARAGGRFITVLATAAWAKDSRNSRFLPTRGSLTRLSGEIAIPGSDLTYYKMFNAAPEIHPPRGGFRARSRGRGRLWRRFRRDP